MNTGTASATSLFTHPIWGDPGTWIALGVSLLTVVVAIAMHRVIRKVLWSNPDIAPAGIEKSAIKREANHHE